MREQVTASLEAWLPGFGVAATYPATSMMRARALVACILLDDLRVVVWFRFVRVVPQFTCIRISRSLAQDLRNVVSCNEFSFGSRPNVEGILWERGD